MVQPTAPERAAIKKFIFPWATRNPENGRTISLGIGILQDSRAISVMTPRYEVVEMRLVSRLPSASNMWSFYQIVATWYKIDLFYEDQIWSILRPWENFIW